MRVLQSCNKTTADSAIYCADNCRCGFNRGEEGCDWPDEDAAADVLGDWMNAQRAACIVMVKDMISQVESGACSGCESGVGQGS
jgi:hypothetical protein